MWVCLGAVLCGLMCSIALLLLLIDCQDVSQNMRPLRRASRFIPTMRLGWRRGSFKSGTDVETIFCFVFFLHLSTLRSMPHRSSLRVGLVGATRSFCELAAAPRKQRGEEMTQRMVPGALLRGAYRTLLKHADFFDARPLAKALLSASPHVRSDNCWLVAFVNAPNKKPKSVSEFLYRASDDAGGGSSSSSTAQSNNSPTAAAAPLSMRDFVRREFRKSGVWWDPARYFASVRRLEAARTLHAECTVEAASRPSLPAVVPRLQLQPDAASSVCAPGSLLLAHPVLGDGFTQAVVLLAAANIDAGTVSGFALNNECGTASFFLDAERLKSIAPPPLLRRIKNENRRKFAEFPLAMGGPINSLPLLLHRSSAIAAAIDATDCELVDLSRDDRFHGAISGPSPSQQAPPLPFPQPAAAATKNKTKGKKAKTAEPEQVVANDTTSDVWFAHSLLLVLTLNKKLLDELTPANCQVVLNCSTWSRAQLRTEILQNWWLATDPQSSIAALPSLLATKNPTHMWQRCVGSLGGDLSDFSRMKVMTGDEDASDFSAQLSDLFSEDASDRSKSMTFTSQIRR